MPSRSAVIIGAGPAGLTAAYELLTRTDIKPLVFEASADLGGISKTVNYKGNRIDIGGHRFFSKSDRVMQWWEAMMPLAALPEAAVDITYRNQKRSIGGGGRPETDDLVMLVRERLSRIFFLRRFFAYPVKLSPGMALALGPTRIIRILASYLKVQLRPIRDERSLEDFFINRFGRELYATFFKDYTEKVWGVACAEIKPEWGAQRVKGLSITKAVLHALRALVARDRTVGQKAVETSLIERFLYPKLGPGQMWEEVARQVVAKGGEIHRRQTCVAVEAVAGRVVSATFRDAETGAERRVAGDFFFSTMAVKDLIAGMGEAPPAAVREVAAGLVYRDFITVGLLVKRMTVAAAGRHVVPDTWIYIQERDVKIGRLQVFNNWSPYLVKDPSTVWLGLEYFCNQGDALWRMADREFIAFATGELAKIGMIDAADVLDATLIRMEKTYPAYFGSYDRFDEIRRYTDTLANLFLIGRNGMHRYNNSDHSMLTAMTAVDNIAAGITAKDNIWAVNTEQDYHEEKGA